MASINTVLGPLDVERLGFTLMHEHVAIASAGVRQTYPELYGDRTALVEMAVRELVEAREGGVETIVDMTTVDLDRDVRLLEEVSRRSGGNIVATTGCWLDPPRALYLRSADEVAALFVREIEEGIGGSGIKAGVIKVANDIEGVTPRDEVIVRAAARAAKQTGAPIITHSYAPGRVGEQQLAIFEDKGVDPGRVCIGHSNDSTDLDYLLGICRRGAYLGLDRYPGQYPGAPPDRPTWEARTETLARLIEAGVGDRLMLSHDWPMLAGFRNSDLEDGRRRNPDGLLFISKRVLPRLRELGVGEQATTELMVENPRRFFGA